MLTGYLFTVSSESPGCITGSHVLPSLKGTLETFYPFKLFWFFIVMVCRSVGIRNMGVALFSFFVS